jgi:4-hydroxy-4-methyl-2-oxoglutarate aldolase
MFNGLRVADVRDGLDYCQLREFGTVSSRIRSFVLPSPRVVGFALTTRYVPYRGRIPTLSSEAYAGWLEEYRRVVAPRPWEKEICEGDIVVIDQCEMDVGILGSRNTLKCMIAGAYGFVTNGGVRDVEQLIESRVPVWAACTAQTMVQGRVQFESFGGSVEIGGQSIETGDLIIADSDGVVVVPYENAEAVARYARREADQDRMIRDELLTRFLDMKGQRIDDC